MAHSFSSIDIKKTLYYADGDLSNFIQITEAMPNPDGPEAEEEWIEIWNGGNSVVNLGDWQLDDSEGGSKPYIIPDTVTLEPKSFALIYRNESGIALNNNEDEIRLFDFTGTLIDEVSYEKAKAAMSYALIEMAGGNDTHWEWVSDSTQGKQNPVYEVLDGTVASLAEGENAFFLSNGIDANVKKIKFHSDVIDPAMVPLALPTSSRVEIVAKTDASGYSLKEIKSVIPPTLETNHNVSWTTWTLLAIIGLSMGTNVYYIAAQRRY